MAFDFRTLEPQIRQILSAPGTDLATISAKRVRRQLLQLDPSLTAEFLRDNKDEVYAVIASIFEKVSSEGGGASHDAENLEAAATEEVDDSEEQAAKKSRKRKQGSEETDYGGEDEGEEEQEQDDTPPPKRAKGRKSGRELSDAELARKISTELNSRSRRTASKGRGNTAGAPKKGARAKKSAAIVDSDEDSADDGNEGKKVKSKKSGGGAAKGGFAKEYALSDPLAAVLQIDKLSRPQVVKQLWVYIKGNELQNPSNKREIVCDSKLKAVFGVEKIDMFKMNKVLGQHLHENEG